MTKNAYAAIAVALAIGALGTYAMNIATLNAGSISKVVGWYCQQPETERLELREAVNDRLAGVARVGIDCD